MTIKVGDELYLLHTGRRAGDPKWTKHVITGETKQSWLIGEGWAQEKISKTTMTTKKNWQGVNERYRTQQQAADYDFCEAWQRPLATEVGLCWEPEKLKKIAAIVGREIA
jgi:hypothetical protein